MKKILLVITLFISYFGYSQNNYIVKTDDGRRVLLKADFTWEYIDLVAPEKKNDSIKVKELAVRPKATPTVPQTPEDAEAELKSGTNCMSANFEEPKLDNRVQAKLKKGRATIKHIKKKVAKDNNCDVDQVKLIWTNETVQKGRYEFCADGKKVEYKRLGNSFYKKGKII